MQVNPRELNADLHAHSTVSDGTLAPADVVARAQAQGVELFALTDHDELGGLAEAQAAADALKLPFVPGVEVSVTFAGHTIHVVGLGIDPVNEPLRTGLAQVRSGRMTRAHEMAEGLARVGIEGTLEGALKYAGNLDLVSRTHFARYLVERGVCADTREVFSRFLTEGKPGYVPHRWASLRDAVGWILGARGVPIIAHPGRYKLTPTEQWALFWEFREAGGIGLEVATTVHTTDQVREFTGHALEFGFEGSRGSDFHGPNESHAELGRVHAMPESLRPVWHRFV